MPLPIYPRINSLRDDLLYIISTKCSDHRLRLSKKKNTWSKSLPIQVNHSFLVESKKRIWTKGERSVFWEFSKDQKWCTFGIIVREFMLYFDYYVLISKIKQNQSVWTKKITIAGNAWNRSAFWPLISLCLYVIENLFHRLV